MGSTDFGNFNDFCRDSTLPVCNLLSPQHDQVGNWGGCQLRGISLSGGRYLGNLGSILLCGVAIFLAAFLIFKSEKKRAAVGRREMQIFLVGYIIISLCEIFSVGVFPLSSTARVAFSGIHIGMIIATTWVLMLNAIVGYQLLDDGTVMSMGLISASALLLFLGTCYIALDTGYSWSGFWDSSYQLPNRNYALYVLYQLIPLIFLVAFYVLESVLVLRVLGEIRPMVYLTAAALLFAIGQVFNYTISKYICQGTNGRIDGAFFQTLFTLLSVIMVWVFWTSITEDDWPAQTSTYP